MMMFLWTATTGWAATLLFGAGASIPYALKAVQPVPGPYLVRLRPHYWLGFVIPAVAFLHAWLPMSVGPIGGLGGLGLVLATGAFFAMIWQVGLGVVLRDVHGIYRRKSRSLHFWTMVLIAGLVCAHIVLNRA